MLADEGSSSPDQTNRVLRRYGKPDHFLRVSFLDEDQLEYRFPLEVNFRTFLESSVKRLLQDGFYLGARKWEVSTFISHLHVWAHCVFVVPWLFSVSAQDSLFVVRHALRDAK